MKMTDAKEKTPNKRKSLAPANDASAKKAKITPQKQNGTPKAQNKKTPKKSPAKQTTPAKQNKSPGGPSKEAVEANKESQQAFNKIQQSLKGDNKAEAIKMLKSKIQEIESQGSNPKNQKKLANLKKILAEAGETVDKPTGKANKKAAPANNKAKPAPKGKGKKVVEEKVEEEEDDDEEESDDVAEEEDSEDAADEEDESVEEAEDEEDEEEEESDDEAEDEEESDEADEEDSEGNDVKEKPKQKQAKKPAEKKEPAKPKYETTNVVFVSNFPNTATEESIREHFSEVGEIVSISMLKNKETDQFMGKAFLKLADKPAFVKCFNFHDTDFEGRTLSVHPAQKQQKKPFSPKFSPGGRGRGRGSQQRGSFSRGGRGRGGGPMKGKGNFNRNKPY